MGAILPPVVVYFDGESYWLADGFHRVHASKRRGHQSIDVDVRQQDRRTAILFSVGANAEHGLPRTNADKRRAVEMLLRDDEWSKKSDRWIAERARLSNTFVSNVRAELSTVDSSRQVAGRDGKVRVLPKATRAKLPPPGVAAPQQIESEPAPPPAPIHLTTRDGFTPTAATKAKAILVAIREARAAFSAADWMLLLAKMDEIVTERERA